MSPAVAAFTASLLRYDQAIHAIADAARADRQDAAANAYAAAAALFGMTGDAAAEARPFLDAAHAAARIADDHSLIAAVEAWADGDPARAGALHRARLAANPRDLAAARIAQINLLDVGDWDGMTAVIETTLRVSPDNHLLLGQLAFAREQAGDLDGAEAAARAALDRIEGDDPWTHHAWAHVLHARGEIDGAIAWVERHAALWERSNAFMHAHAWWHAAVGHIDADRPDAALALYDKRLAGGCGRCVQRLVARVGLLARLELAGVDVGERWQPVADAAATRAGDRVSGFLDLHYLYALARAGRPEADALRHALGSTAADGLAAHARGDHPTAAFKLAEAAPVLPRLGGSHEQRDLYELVELDAALNAGVRSQARAILDRRIAARPAIGWQRRLRRSLDRAA